MTVQIWTGKSLHSKSDLVCIRGEGTYVDDVRLPGMVYAGFVRSPYGHAKLGGLATKNLPAGVLDIVTGEDLKKLTNPVESVESVIHPNLKTNTFPWYALPSDYARYVGEPVAAFVVEHPYLIEDVLETLQFDYESLTAISSMDGALAPGAPRLYDNWKDNVLLDFHFESEDVDDAFHRADYILETRLKMHRHTAAPIENRAYLADYNKRNSFLTMWSTTQAPHVARTFLSGMLNIPESSMRVIQPNVGGAFGRGHPVYPEELMVCLLSMRLGRPVKWVGSRTECLLTDVHSREQIHEVRAGFRKDGKLLVTEDKIFADMGVFQPTGGVPSNVVTAKLVPGPYKLGEYRVRLLGVCTNKSAFGAYRGFGKESAALVYERIMDLAAEKLGIDPAHIRFKNFIGADEFPYRNPIGEVYDSGNYPECLRKVLKLVEYDKLREEQKTLRSEGKYMGIGIASILAPCSLDNPDNLYSGWDSATVTMDPSGNLTILAGVTSPGTQHAASFPQIVADELGVDPERIRLVEGDTLTCPYGSGNWSDRGMTIGGSAVLLAAQRLKEKIALIAAYNLHCEKSDLQFDNGIVKNTKDDSSMTLANLGWLAHASLNKLPPGVEPGLIATASFAIPTAKHGVQKDGRWSMYPIYSNNATVVVVEVDPESYKVRIIRYCIVDDSGKVVNPAVVDSQLIGAAAQGISGVFLENLPYDVDGQLQATTFMDYLLATALDLPTIEIDHFEVPSPITPMGTKGAGESGIVGPYAALCAAVEDAMKPSTVKVTELPLSPENLWKLFNKKTA